jgi:hypothetical protein
MAPTPVSINLLAIGSTLDDGQRAQARDGPLPLPDSVASRASIGDHGQPPFASLASLIRLTRSAGNRELASDRVAVAH